jgi:hypothetical protein
MPYMEMLKRKRKANTEISHSVFRGIILSPAFCMGIENAVIIGTIRTPKDSQRFLRNVIEIFPAMYIN